MTQLLSRPKGVRNPLRCNHRFFDEVTPETAYFAGLIASDGCVMAGKTSKQQPKIYLGVTDLELVEAFAAAIEWADSLEVRERGRDKTVHVIRFSSKGMAESLELLYGVTCKKSLTFNPTLPLTHPCAWAFLKGICCGDGSLTRVSARNQLRLKVYGTYELCCWIKDLTGVGSLYHDKRKAALWSWTTTNLNVMRKIKSSTPHGLKRKWEKVPDDPA
jgi:hypothetical protein